MEIYYNETNINCPFKKAIFVVVYFFGFQDRIFLCNNADCPGIFFIDQYGVELSEISLPLLPSAGLKGGHHHHQA